MNLLNNKEFFSFFSMKKISETIASLDIILINKNYYYKIIAVIILINLFLLLQASEFIYYAKSIASYLNIKNNITFVKANPEINVINYKHFQKILIVINIAFLLFTYILSIKFINFKNFKLIKKYKYLIFANLVISLISIHIYSRIFKKIVEQFHNDYSYTGALQNITGSGILYGVLAIVLTICIIIYEHKKSKFFNAINFYVLTTVIATLFIVFSHLRDPIVLTKENIRPKVQLNEKSSSFFYEKNASAQSNLVSENLKKISFDEYLKISQDPIYENKNLGIKSAINYIKIDNTFDLNLLNEYYNNILLKNQLSDIVIPPSHRKNNEIILRLDSHNKYNLCYFILLQKNETKNNLIVVNDQVQFEKKDDLDQCFNNIKNNISSPSINGINYELNTTKYSQIIDNLNIDIGIKKKLFEALEGIRAREGLTSDVAKAQGTRDKNFTDPLYIETMISHALGNKVHHVHSYVESFYRANGDLLSLFISPGQYGFGPLYFSKLLSNSNNAFDISIRGSEIFDIIILLITLCVLFIYKDKYLIFCYLSTIGILLLYMVGGEYAPGLHYIRILPQLVLIYAYIFLSPGLHRKKLGLIFSITVFLSLAYSFEFGLFTVLSYILAEIFIQPNILKDIKRALLISILFIFTTGFIFIKLFISTGGARNFEYLFGIGLGITPFSLINFIILVVVLIPIILCIKYRSYLLGEDSFKLKYLFFFSVLAAFVSIKFHWNTSFNHLIITIPIICISYKILNDFNWNRYISFIAKYTYIIFALYLSSIIIGQNGNYVNKLTQNNTLINSIDLTPAPQLGRNILVSSDVLSFMHSLESMKEDYPIISFQDSLASIYYKKKISSYYSDFSTNIRNERDLNLTIQYLTTNFKCVYIEKNLLLENIYYIPLIPASYASLGQHQMALSKERSYLMRLSKYLVQNFYTKLVDSNNNFYKYCSI